MMSSRMLLMSVAMAISQAALSQTYYVDDDNFGKPGMDGSSETLAFGTIQEAVDAAASGSTILVLPGTYDKGGAEHSGCSNRVCVVAKKLTIRSTGGKGVTTIAGAKDPDTLDDPAKCGNGPRAVRAFKIPDVSSENMVVVEGFTVRESAVQEPSAATEHNYGGAVFVKSSVNTRYACFVDCDFTDCVGSRGLLFGGTYVRCGIFDNYLPDGKGTATYRGNLLHCVVARNAQGGVVSDGKAVNCTLMDCGGVNNTVGLAGTESASFYNCLMQQTRVKGEKTVLDHCVATLTEAPSGNYTATDCDLDADVLQCVSPLTDDFRLRPTSRALGFGEASAVADFWVPAGVDRYVDYYGNPIPQTGKIAAGAVQEAAEPASGTVTFDRATVLADGRPRKSYVAGGYACATDYPAQWHVKPVVGAGRHLYGLRSDGLPNTWMFPETDDTLWIMPPPLGTDLAFEVKTTESAIYVDPANGRDESTGADDVRGTADKPFRTLQAAVDLAKLQSNASHDPFYLYAVIYAAEGVYDQGGAVEGGMNSRVAVSSYVRIKGAGAGRSIIKGHVDRESEASLRSVDGRGPLAVRCAYLGAGALQGFTLTDGRCAYDDGRGGHTADVPATRGGGVLCAGSVSGSLGKSSSFVLDCVITNCIAVRGASVFYGNVYRSEVTDTPYGQARYASFHSCVFRRASCEGRTDLDPALSTEPPIGGGCSLTQCTDYGLASAGCYDAEAIPSLNAVSARGGALTERLGRNFKGCLVWDYASYAASHYTVADPEFVDAAGGDFSVHGSSPALDCGLLPADYWTVYSSDFNSEPVAFVKGRPVAGAFQKPLMDRAAIVVSQTSGKGNVSTTGRKVVNGGEELTVSAGDTTRHLLGLEIDGELKDVTSWTFAGPAPGSAPAGLTTVVAVYSTNWYVNANTDAANGPVGDDANDGFTPETAKRTLEKVMGVDLEAGDVIHAAPGTYAEGQMSVQYSIGDESKDAPVRVCVRPGVTLLGDAGAEKTIIRGAVTAYSGSVPFGGEGSVRCANLGEGATIDGFTLTGGSTPYASGYRGGGVIAPLPSSGSKLPLVQNCIVSNNWARRGGGTVGGAFRGCRFVDNYSAEDGNAAWAAMMENCLVDANRGKSSGCAVIRYPYGLYNVTMTERNISVDSGASSQYFVYDGSQYAQPCNNCVILGGTGNCKNMPTAKCIFKVGLTYDETSWSRCEKMAVADVKLGEDGRPEADSPVVDQADASLLSAAAAKLDAAGCQRIYNGALDIGCFEFDWRPAYAAAIGAGVAVTDASEGVKLTAGKVCIPDGGTVVGMWPAASGNGRYAVPMTAVGGTLSGAFANATASFEKAVSVTDGEETAEFRLNRTALDFAFSFEGTGHGELAGFTQLVPGFTLFIR